MNAPGIKERGFTVIEMLVSAGIMAIILVCMATLINMISSAYQRTMGRLDSFETARAAFDTIGRVARQATLQSYVGYDTPIAPTAHVLKSDLHFITGRQDNLGLGSLRKGPSDALFFQAPLGLVESTALQRANTLLTSTGFFIAYGPDPLRPNILSTTSVANRHRYRLYQFIEPREKMSLYSRTITMDDTIPVSAGAYSGHEWFSEPIAVEKRSIHPLAENIVALRIWPVYEGVPRKEWNSRNRAIPGTLNRLPQALEVVMLVLNEKSAERLGESAGEIVPVNLLEDPANIADDLKELEDELVEKSIDFRIYRTVIPLDSHHIKL
jgi:uncharacterized protein (TIGR02599 family)